MFKWNVVTFCLLTIFSFCSPSCAINSSEREDRILGTSTTLRNHVSVASIRLVNLQRNFHVCGGFIINKHWVGTAAQCMTGKTINNTVVAVGSTNIGEGTVYELNRIEKHNYNALTLANDIALLRTATEIIFSTSVRPISLSTDILTTPRSLRVYGWGRTSAGSNLSNSLRAATFTTLTHQDCLNSFPFVARRFINDRHICSAFSSRATCPGDAGGPLVLDDTVVGITSWVEPCVAGQVNVNTRISFYANWILSFTREDD